jgi:C-terminal processing protease CtpA/Prc
MNPDIAEALGLEMPRGFLVVDVVAGSPAEKAGIKGGEKPTTIDGREILLGGDVITKFDGRDVRKIDDILVYLQREKAVGDSLYTNGHKRWRNAGHQLDTRGKAQRSRVSMKSIRVVCNYLTLR